VDFGDIPSYTQAITVEKLAGAESATVDGTSIVAEAEDARGVFYRPTLGKGARWVHVD